MAESADGESNAPPGPAAGSDDKIVDAPRYVIVEGPIGVGKTTLTRKLAATFDVPTLLEPATENPFLDRFYRNPRAHALSTQLFFLLTRARQMEDIASDDLLGPSLIADFMIQKDRLFAELTLDAQELALYNQIFDSLNIRNPQPDLVVYLQAPTDVLLRRIRHRGIASEAQIERHYLERLAETYTRFFHFYNEAPLLIVNAAEIDLADNDDHFDALLREIMSNRGPRHYFNPNPMLL
ncbi:MAG: deoxynucleoside kinase [Pseudomonadota bacterium]